MSKASRILYLKNRISQIESALEAQRILVELKQRGDIHILNVHRFFGIWVDKAHKLRDAIKAVVFGVIYGMSSKTLGNNIYAKDKAVAAEELKALEKRERELMAILDEG